MYQISLHLLNRLKEFLKKELIDSFQQKKIWIIKAELFFFLNKKKRAALIPQLQKFVFFRLEWNKFFFIFWSNVHFFLEAFSANFSALRWSFSRSLRSRSRLRLSLSAAARSSLRRCLSRARSAACGTSNLILGDSIVNSSSPRTPLAAKWTTYASSPVRIHQLMSQYLSY